MADAAPRPAFAEFLSRDLSSLKSGMGRMAGTLVAASLMLALLAGLAGLQLHAEEQTRQAFFKRFDTRAENGARFFDALLGQREMTPDSVGTSVIGRTYLGTLSPVGGSEALLVDGAGMVVSSGEKGLGQRLEALHPVAARELSDRSSGIVTEKGTELYFVEEPLRDQPWSLLLLAPTSEIVELSYPWLAWLLLTAFAGVAGVTLTLLHRSRGARADLDESVTERTLQLEESNKELEAFAYSVSHDLRAPLRGIDGFSQVLADELKDDLSPEGQRYLYRIRFNAQRMQELIDDLLRFSRLSRQELRHEKVDVNRIVVELRHLMDADPNGARCDWHVEDLPACQGDPGLIRQVFSNLFDNARKYAGNRDQPKIEVGALSLDEEHQRVTYFVRDNGVGFDMAYADKLFGVFQRLHRAEEYEGTGVGLATVQRIVRRHEGRVWAESAPDEGATFYLTLEKG